MRVSSSCSAVVFALCLGVSNPSPAAPPAAEKVVARIELSKPFHLPKGASVTAAQGPDVTDASGDPAPGYIDLCIRAAAVSPCAPQPEHGYDSNYLEAAEIVYPRGRAAPPLLHLQMASVHAANNGQGHAAIIMAYRPAKHQFERIFYQEIGGNRNQRVRYIASGALRGAMISAEPTDNAPFGYWITVNRLTPAYRYRQVLRYRSAMHYNDGNRLAVIDSEMPNILGRLGLWHPGDPLPVPKSGCAHPRLVKTELWCS